MSCSQMSSTWVLPLLAVCPWANCWTGNDLSNGACHSYCAAKAARGGKCITICNTFAAIPSLWYGPWQPLLVQSDSTNDPLAKWQNQRFKWSPLPQDTHQRRGTLPLLHYGNRLHCLLSYMAPMWASLKDAPHGFVFGPGLHRTMCQSVLEKSDFLAVLPSSHKVDLSLWMASL